MSSNILTDRDVNAQQPVTQVSADEKPKTMEYHRQVLQSKLKDEKEPSAYVSPSDTIQSPATQKLQAFKSKQASKKLKPQTLFAKTSSKNYEAARGKPLFADVKDEKEDASKE